MYASIRKAQGHIYHSPHVSAYYNLHGDPQHVTLFNGDIADNVYQVRIGLQDFMLLKVTSKKIWEAFPELIAKVNARERLEVNKQREKNKEEIGTNSTLY